MFTIDRSTELTAEQQFELSQMYDLWMSDLERDELNRAISEEEGQITEKP